MFNIIFLKEHLKLPLGLLNELIKEHTIAKIKNIYILIAVFQYNWFPL